jgi:hypothetical protein
MSIAVTPLKIEIMLWLIVCVGLSIVVGEQVGWGRSLSPATPRLDSGLSAYQPPTLQAPFSLLPADSFLEVTLRPLFISTRRPPPPPPPVEPPKPTMRKGQFILVGVTIVPPVKVAFLHEISRNKVVAVHEGQQVNGVSVDQIEERSVTLKQYDDQEQLGLKVNALPRKNQPPTTLLQPATAITTPQVTGIPRPAVIQPPTATPTGSAEPAKPLQQPPRASPPPAGEQPIPLMLRNR